MHKVSVLGSGAFGTAMAYAAAHNQHIGSVTIYGRQQDVVDHINKENSNPKFMPDKKLHKNINATTNLKEALENSKIVLSCIPVQSLTAFIKENKQLINNNVPFVSCSKGIILESGKLISEMIRENLSSNQKYACLSGPSFAREIILQYPSSLVVASQQIETAKLIQLGISNPFFRVYTQTDVVGVELAGALKNIIAIGAGIIEGAGYGFNTQTAFITRSVGEMQRYARLHGASKHTFYGLAGIGDLMLTSILLSLSKCFGSTSRNRTFGVKLGKGMTVEQILAESSGVVEGLPTLELVYQRIQQQHLDMPVTTTLHDFVKNKLDKQAAIKKLMQSALTDEFQPTFEDLL